MPDDILISELSNAPQIDDSAVFPFSQDNGGSLATFKASMSDIAGKVAEGTTFVNLQTTSKTLVGAINEAAQGGGSADIISSASGSIATFNDGGDNIPVKSLVTEITATQAGTGTPSPNNPRAISGFDEVDVVVTGVNLINPAVVTANSRLRASNGTVATNSSYPESVSDYIPVKGGQSYYFKLGSLKSATWGQAWYDKNQTYISGILSDDENENKPFTAPNNACYLRVTVTAIDNNAVNYPSTVTEYQEYKGITTHTITLPETIYGGTAELVSGNGTKTDKEIVLSTLTWTYNSGRNVFISDIISDAKIPATTQIVPDWKCEVLKVESATNIYNYATTYDNSIGILNSGSLVISCQSAQGDTTTLGTILNGKKLVYELATPTTFNTTPEQIPTLSGTNNIYSNSGDVEVEYFNENADQMAELIRVMTR